MDVFAKEPYFASNFETRFWEARSVGVLSLGCLSVSNLGFEGGVELGKRFGKGDNILMEGDQFPAGGNLGQELGLQTVVSEEGANSEGLGKGVIVSELG